jgi:hypothetical protein
VVIAFAPNLGDVAGSLLTQIATTNPDLDVMARAMWSSDAVSALERGVVRPGHRASIAG